MYDNHKSMHSIIVNLTTQLAPIVIAHHCSKPLLHSLHPQCVGNAGWKETSTAYIEQGLELREKKRITPMKRKKKKRRADSVSTSEEYALGNFWTKPGDNEGHGAF